VQNLGRCRPGGAHRGFDAAAVKRDLFVARAAQAPFVFGDPVAAVDEMRVAIDQSGRHPQAGDVAYRNAPLSRMAHGDFRGADPGDTLAFDGERRVRDAAVRTRAGRHRRDICARPDHVPVRVRSWLHVDEPSDCRVRHHKAS